ncbi:MAG: hypothetical protein LBG27_09525 [Spirochaetaceae bacterium]|jgi:hypothetical protein|nr:hypothetical protein [Spirochaetaceae bacterium]
MKKFTLVMAVLLSVSLFLIGCGDAEGALGPAGSAAPIYLSGPQTADGINDALASGAPVVFAGVTQSDTDEVVIPAGKGVKLVGTPAYTVNTSGGTLVLGNASSVSGTGTIEVPGSGILIADQTVLDNNVTGVGTKVAYQTIGTGGTVSGTPVAVKGPVSITTAGATGTAIKVSEIAGKTLIVYGDLTVSDAVAATAINVVGNATATAAITGTVKASGKVTFNTTAQTALTGLTAGSVESAVNIATTGDGNINVTGGLKTTGTATVLVHGTGTLDAGSLDLVGDLTTGTGSVTVNGASVLRGAVALKGATTFKGDVTLTADKTVTLSSSQAVSLASAKSIKVGADTVLSAKSGAPVVLTPAGATTIAAAAKKLTVAAHGLTITSGGLAVGAGAELAIDTVSLTVTAADASLALTGGATTTGAKLTGTGKVVLGNASIAGSTGGWQAVGANTSIAFSTGSATTVAITGTGTSPKLVGGASAGAITLGTSGSNYTALTVTTAEIDLTTGGSLVIPQNSTASTVVLKGGTATLGKLTLKSANETTNVSSSHYAKIYKTGETAKTAGISGDGIVVKGVADSDDTGAGSVAGGADVTTNDATITGQSSTNDVTLDNSALFSDS